MIWVGRNDEHVLLIEGYSQSIVDSSSSVRMAAENLETSGLGICLVVEPAGKLVGVVSDGDIRRGLLQGKTLEDSVVDVMSTAFTFSRDNSELSELQRIARSRLLTHLPLLSAEGLVTGLFVDKQENVEFARDNLVVIMAGGKGLRLRPLTDTTPKPMIPVAGKPMLQRIVEGLRFEGFRKFALSINYLGEQIETHFGDGSDFDVEISYLKEEIPLGTGGALSLLESNQSRPLIVVNGDVLLSAKLVEMLNFHEESGASLTVGVKVLDTQIPYGVVQIEGHSIKAIQEKPTYRDFVNAGVYVVEPQLLGLVPKGIRFDMPELVEKVIESGDVAVAFPLHEAWLDLGRPEDLDRAQREHEGS